MTISSSNRKAGPYTGNGVTTSFSFSFKVFKAADLEVVKTDLSSVESTLVLGSDYTVTLNSNQNSNPGGSIVLTSAPATGFKITITSSLAYTQALDLTNQGGFYPSTINDALDRVTILVQQLNEQVQRCAKLPISSTDDANVLSTNIAVLAANLPVLVTCANNISAITAVSANAANINAVNANSANINTVAGNMSSVAAVGTNIANVNTVAGNTANINIAAANMSSIIAAPAAAASAASSAATAAATAGYSATTSTPLTVPTSGSVSMTVQTGKSFSAGIGVYITSSSNSGVSMQGTITSYNASTGALVVNVTTTTGTGSFSDGVIVTAASVSGSSGYASIYKFQ